MLYLIINALIYLRYTLRCGITDSIILCLIFWRSAKLFWKVATQIYTPMSNVQELNFFLLPHQYLLSSDFLIPAVMQQVWSGISVWFWLYFPWRISMCLLTIVYLWRNCYSKFLSYLKSSCLFFTDLRHFYISVTLEPLLSVCHCCCFCCCWFMSC